MIKFIRGESVTITIIYPDAYEVANLLSQKVFIETASAFITPTATDNARVFRVELGSQLTKRLGSTVKMQVEILDSVMGYKRSEAVQLTPTIATGQPATDEVNAGSDATVNLLFADNGITTDVVLASVLRGYSAYDIAVQNGFSGTEVEYALQAAPLFTVDLVEKGNGDVITHNSQANARILTFFDDGDNGRQRSDFYASNSTTSGFTLSNDFTNDKFTGTLLCVKY